MRAIAAVVMVGAVTGAMSRPASASGDDDKKTYTVDVDGTVATPAAGAFAVYAGDADAVVNFTLKNTAKEQTLGSANITVPAPFTVVSAPVDTVPGGPVLELRNLGIKAGKSLTFSIVVDVRTCTSIPAPSFSITAKQRNDYNGSGNDFSLKAAASDTRLDVTGSCILKWLGQPTGAEKSATITTTEFTPSGSGISIEVRDAGDTGRATSSNALVSLTVANPSIPSPIIGGTLTSTAVAGLATFTPGPSLATSAFGYTLAGTSPGLTSSGPSDPFAVVDKAASCAANSACDASSSAANQTATAAFAAGTDTSRLLLSVGAGDVPNFACVGYPRRADLVVSQFLFTSTSSRTGTFTVAIKNPTSPVKSYEVCWAAPYSFATKPGTPLTVQGTKPGTSLPLYVGLLPKCSTGDDDDDHDDDHRDRVATPVPPCISARTYNSSTKTLTLAVFTSASDPWRY
ncbi:MAG: hypothetical protein AB7L13_12045 [Acidimicrobiia bacterium]